ncbi:MAG: MFS transporter [Verrucomicrobiales bacterium]|nr:MFS transporter [Verrucomicrobiales bacterium]
MTEKQSSAGQPLSSAQWMVLLAAFLGWLFDGFEIGLFPVVARPALLSMLGEGGDAAVGPWMAKITAAFLIGAAAGGLVFGWLGDRVGRVRALAISILVYSLFTGCGYFAQTPTHLAIFRFIAALGMGGEWALGVALVMECWPEKWRPLLAGAIGAAANFGFLLTGLVARVWPPTPESWRTMFLIGALPALLVFLIRLAVPESKRWQDSVKDGKSKPLVEIFAPGIRGRTLLAIVFASVALIGTWGSVTWIPLWANQLVSREAQSQLKAENPGWYQADGTPASLSAEEAAKRAALESEGKRSAGMASGNVQMIQGLGAILGCIIAPLLGAQLGRRIAFFLLCLGSLAMCALMFRTISQFDASFMAYAFGVSAVTASFYGWFPLYFPELFPTRIRATGQGLCFNFGRIFAAGGALLQGELVRTLGGSYPQAGAIVTLVYLVGMALIWFAPETKGKPLPE